MRRYWAIGCTALLATVAFAQGAATVSVATINMDKVKDPERVLSEWRKHPEIWNSGIVLLQEVSHSADGRPSMAERLAKEMNRYVVSTPSLGGSRDTDGLAIISRYPLTDSRLMQLAHNGMVFHTRNRMAIAATAQTPSGPLRVYNVHLDSRVNAKTRLRQIEPVLAEAAAWHGPRLIGGDFNTNPLRWAGNVVPIGLSSQARAMEKEMGSHGFTASEQHGGPTSDFLRMHLDWVYTRDVAVIRTAVQPLGFSDHHAVLATLGPFAAPADAAVAAGTR